VKKTLKSDAVYHNFLRCLALYNNEIVSRNELANLVSPFIGKSPELLQDLHKILGLESPEAKAETRIAPTTQPTQIQIVPARPEPPIQPKVETGESGSITQPTIPKARVLKNGIFRINFPRKIFFGLCFSEKTFFETEGTHNSSSQDFGQILPVFFYKFLAKYG